MYIVLSKNVKPVMNDVDLADVYCALNAPHMTPEIKSKRLYSAIKAWRTLFKKNMHA